MSKHHKKKCKPQSFYQSSLWTVKFILILVFLQVVMGQNPHDVLQLLQLMLQAHH